MTQDAVTRGAVTRGAVTPVAPGHPAISIIVPVFNEEESLETLVEEIGGAIAARDEGYEIVAVDDGSTDASLRILRSLAAAEPRLRPFSSPSRRGQSAAMAAGLRHARGEIFITLDADLQNDPADISQLLDALAGYDLVSGIRRRRRDPWIRRLAGRIANGVRRRLLDDGVHDVGCSLKAYRREVVTDLPVFEGMHRFLPALARLRGARIREVDVNHRPRRHGRSKYGIGNRLWRGILDLLGVWWLQRRWIDLSSYEEITAPPGEEPPKG